MKAWHRDFTLPTRTYIEVRIKMCTRLTLCLFSITIIGLAVSKPAEPADTQQAPNAAGERDESMRAIVDMDGWVQCIAEGNSLRDLTLDVAKMPEGVLRKLSCCMDRRKLGPAEIHELAKRHFLLDVSPANPNLRFQEGDLAYFAEQGLKGHELELEFLARRIIRAVAERDHIEIKSNGDWSFWAEKLRNNGLDSNASRYWSAPGACGH